MRLAEYLRKHKLTHEKFADMIGVTRPLVTRLANRRTNPSTQVVRRIELVTKGEVLFSDLYIDMESKRIKKKTFPSKNMD